MKSIYAWLWLGSLVVATACSPFSGRFYHDAPYDHDAVPLPPDYTQAASWAALPGTTDQADRTPPGVEEQQRNARADVFFIYPTIYTNKPGSRFPWNADVQDKKLNAAIESSTIRMQASIFNGAGRVFAPRYRQAHIAAYYTSDSSKARAVFDTAYQDLKSAFEYYLKHHNAGRPIIIAGHSQGTTHGKRLVREYFENKPLYQQLVAAYLVGIPVEADYFSGIPLCADSTATGCFVSWRTWQRPATPWTKKGVSPNTPYPLQVNPLSWTPDTTYMSRAYNRGGTLRKLKLVDRLADAQLHQGILWINQPQFFGKRFFNIDNWHAGDYNLFYMNVRENAKLRVAHWHMLNSQ